MKLVWATAAWDDYQYWCRTNTKVRDKINVLIAGIERDPFRGIGKPEPLKREFAGYWSRRITHEHRLIYRVKGSELQIVQCRYHYHR